MPIGSHRHMFGDEMRTFHNTVYVYLDPQHLPTVSEGNISAVQVGPGSPPFASWISRAMDTSATKGSI